MYKAKDKRIRIINNSVNNIAKARNIGIDKAKGKYIIFIDSDDYIDKEAIYVLYKEIKHHNADVCFCGIESFEKDEKNNKKIGINLKNEKYNHLICIVLKITIY